MTPAIATSVFFQSLPQPFAVVGMGLTGRSVLRLLKNQKVSAASILTFDEKDSSAQFCCPVELMSKKPKTLIISPGVPLSSPWIQLAKESGVLITSELEIAFSFLSTEKVIGITGSIGKSTTASLLGAGAKKISPYSFVGGNLGTPLAEYISDLLEGKTSRAPWVILELSSYQLENFTNLICDFSIITFLTPNHMERYSSLEEYYHYKISLHKRTKGLLVLNSRGGDLPNFKEKIHGKSIWTDRNSPLLKNKNLLPSSMIGTYNLDNLALAATVADAAGWPAEAFTAMKEFSGLPHRLENLGIIQGIQFINDSKATTIESVIQAIETVVENTSPASQLWVLLGGHDKGLPWKQLKNSKATHANVRPIFFGEFGSQAKNITGLDGPVYKTLSLALRDLPHLCRGGDVVLLSPGGTSHDEFKNFEERGSFFSRTLKELFKI